MNTTQAPYEVRLDDETRAAFRLPYLRGCAWAVTPTGYKVIAHGPHAAIDPRGLERSAIVDAEHFHGTYREHIEHQLWRAEFVDADGRLLPVEIDIEFDAGDVYTELLALYGDHYGYPLD